MSIPTDGKKELNKNSHAPIIFKNSFKNRRELNQNISTEKYFILIKPTSYVMVKS